MVTRWPPKQERQSGQGIPGRAPVEDAVHRALAIALLHHLTRKLAPTRGRLPHKRWTTSLGTGHDQTRRLKDMDRKKTQLKTVVAGLAPDKLILNEAFEANDLAPPAVGAVSITCGAS